jgi:hypothetical protein
VVPALAPGERVVATFTDAEIGPLVATDRALCRGDGGGWARLGWEQIDHAVRDQRGQRLLVYLWPADSPRCVTLRVPPESPLVALVRQRVSATTLLTTQVRLGDLGQARVTVRRRPATQELLWVVRLDPSVDATDTRLPVHIDTAIRQLAAAAGLTT